MIAFRVSARLAVRRTDAMPISTHGVPPILSRVQKEKPWRAPADRASVMRTHSSRCLDSSPMSYFAGPSA